jgi:O-antigen ligase
LAFVVTEQAPRRQFVLALLAVINALWVFLSASRGNLLIAAVCLAFVLTGMRLRRALGFGIVAALVSVVVLSQFTTLQERAVERLHLLTDPSESVHLRTSGRSDLAWGAWYMFRDHPFGVGTGGFLPTWLTLGAREGIAQSRGLAPRAAHSGWMKILAENGFPGILLLGAYVFSFAVSGWRSRDPVLRRLGLMVTAVFAVAGVSMEFQAKGLWLLAAGATVLLDRGSIRRAAPSGNSIADG